MDLFDEFERIMNNSDNYGTESRKEILTAKTRQNPYVAKKFLQTGDYLIVEDSPYDSYWGCGIERNGENHLGRIWMKIREQLKTGNMK